MSHRHLMKKQAHEEFEAWAKTYDQSPLNHFLFQPSYRAFLAELYAWRKNRPEPFDLLDVGCGTGTFDAMLSSTNLPVRVHALDYSPAMCRQAQEKAQAAHIRRPIRHVAADSEHLPFADRSFDAITCSNSFHHYPHQQAVIHEMHRILRPGGLLMLIDGFRDNVIGWVVFDVIITAIEKHVYHAPWHVIDNYLRTAGFQDVRRRKFNFWFPSLISIAVA